MKHRKALLELTDPGAIRSELTRHEARLERVQQEMLKSKSTEATPTPSANITSPEKGILPEFVTKKQGSGRVPVMPILSIIFNFIRELTLGFRGTQIVHPQKKRCTKK